MKILPLTALLLVDFLVPKTVFCSFPSYIHQNVFLFSQKEQGTPCPTPPFPKTPCGTNFEKVKFIVLFACVLYSFYFCFGSHFFLDSILIFKHSNYCLLFVLAMPRKKNVNDTIE